MHLCFSCISYWSLIVGYIVFAGGGHQKIIEGVMRGGGGYCQIWAIQVLCCLGMCRCEGYGFQAVYSGIGYINQRVQVQNSVSFSRKLINQLKILVQIRDCGISFCFVQTVLVTSIVSGNQLLQVRGVWEVYSGIGQQNSAELALVQVKGSKVLAAHPHPEIP